MLDSEFLQTIFITFKLAFITTLILLPLGIACAAGLAGANSRAKVIFEALIWMPLILPPSVLGFYLLGVFSKSNFLGAFLQSCCDFQLTFSFAGLVVASVIFSLPFMTNPVKTALEALPKSLAEASYTLGKSRFYTFARVLLPNIKGAIALGAVTSFAHTIGEFGVVMMIGGSVAGETKVASIAIYEEVEALNYALAHQYALTLFIVSFSSLCLIFWLSRRNKTLIF